MDALDFFSYNSGLPIPAKAKPDGDGLCQHCSRTVKLYRNGQLIGCGPCMTMRMAYPLGKNQFTLGSADYAVIKPSGSVFYSNLSLPGSATIQPSLKGPEIYGLLSDLGREREEFLFIHFGQPTVTRNFRINPATPQRHYLYVSGDTAMGGRNIAAINMWLIQRLHNYQLSQQEWQEIVDLKARLRDPDRGETVFARSEMYRTKYPGLVVPEKASIEYKILEMMSHVDDSPRSKAASTPKPRRKRSG